MSGSLLLTNKNTGNVFADVVRVNSEEIIFIDVDAFLPLVAPSSGLIDWSTAVTANVRSLDGTTIAGHFARTSDGTLGFVQDVNSYVVDLIRNTALNRSILRSKFPNILSTQEAHHLISVGLLDDNIVQAAVLNGFDFNGAINGIPLQKYVASTGVGRHAPHGNYTQQIRDYLQNVWGPNNPGWTPAMAQQELEDLTFYLRNKIETTSGRINLLDLGL